MPRMLTILGAANLPKIGNARAFPAATVRQHRIARLLGACATAIILAGPVFSQDSVDGAIDNYRERMAADSQKQQESPEQRPPESSLSSAPVARPVPAQAALPPRQALMTGAMGGNAVTPQMVLNQIPDPTTARQVYEQRMNELAESLQREPRVVSAYRRVIDYALELLEDVRLPNQKQLSLAECIQRAVMSNYSIRVQSYNPAIAQTQVVQAEAAFDAEFFLDSAYAKQDNAVASELSASNSDARQVRGGIRQLLPTGMTASTSLNLQRTFTSLEFATLNPAYSNSFIAEFSQPLLRNFGIDFNRAQIDLSKAEQRASYQRFVQEVRERIFDTERAYWDLARRRRAAAILAVAVAQNFTTYQAMIERQRHDATPVELANSESRYRQRLVQYLEAIKDVRDAEDALKNFMNDPEFKLSERLEIIPTDTPLVAPLTVDHFAEVRAALDGRSEIRQARLAIEQSRVRTMQAKNQTLPQLDVGFQYEVQGIGISADDSFDSLTTNRFISYAVNLTFSYPIGNRARLAALRRSRLQESQTIVALQQIMDAVVTEVNVAVRNLMVRFQQIPPQLEAVVAAERNLRALQARTQRIDPSYLETELNAVEQLTNTRVTLLNVVTDYNVSVVELERAKGTLLQHNNIVLTDEPDRKR